MTRLRDWWRSMGPNQRDFSLIAFGAFLMFLVMLPALVGGSILQYFKDTLKEYGDTLGAIIGTVGAFGAAYFIYNKERVHQKQADDGKQIRKRVAIALVISADLAISIDELSEFDKTGKGIPSAHPVLNLRRVETLANEDYAFHPEVVRLALDVEALRRELEGKATPIIKLYTMYMQTQNSGKSVDTPERDLLRMYIYRCIELYCYLSQYANPADPFYDVITYADRSYPAVQRARAALNDYHKRLPTTDRVPARVAH